MAKAKRYDLHALAIRRANIALELFGECFAAITEGRIAFAASRFRVVEMYADESANAMADARKARGAWVSMVQDPKTGRWVRLDQLSDAERAREGDR